MERQKQRQWPILIFFITCVCCSSAPANSTTTTMAGGQRKHKENSTEKLWAAEEVFFKSGDEKEGGGVSAGPTWCVAKNNAADDALQAALDYACGLGGVDCRAIQQGGPCFQPDNVQSHASYAFNAYFLGNSMLAGTCDFNGTALPTIQDPSYHKCVYPSSASYSASASSKSNGFGPSSSPPSPSFGVPSSQIPLLRLLFLLMFVITVTAFS